MLMLRPQQPSEELYHNALSIHGMMERYLRYPLKVAFPSILFAVLMDFSLPKFYYSTHLCNTFFNVYGVHWMQKIEKKILWINWIARDDYSLENVGNKSSGKLIFTCLMTAIITLTL